MTRESSMDRAVPPLTLVEYPEAAEPAHQPVARRLGLRQQLGRQARLPFQQSRLVDAPQDREQEPRPRPGGIEAERRIEIDDARPAVLGDQDVVALAQVDVGHAAGVDLPDELPEPLEHRTDLRAFPAAPAGDALPLDRLHQDAARAGFAVALRDPVNPVQPAEGAQLPDHLAASQEAHGPRFVAEILEDGPIPAVRDALDIGFRPGPLPDDLDRQRV